MSSDLSVRQNCEGATRHILLPENLSANNLVKPSSPAYVVMYPAALAFGLFAVVVALNPGVIRNLPILGSIMASPDDTETTMPQPIPLPEIVPDAKEQHIHLIVLVHGIFGRPLEMGNLEEYLRQRSDAAILAKKKEDEEESPEETRISQQFIVHSTACNLDRTHDGVVAGGSRLADEVNVWLAATLALFDSQEHDRPTDITLSIVGNSLGGLYARYALSKIHWTDPSKNNSQQQQQQQRLLRPAVFCTTVTPHLGVGGPHTYAPVGRVVEYGIATALGMTGRDLFRFTPVLQDMATEAAFLHPLSQFRRRIAYANAYYTDFQVPGSSAAFLGASDALHRVVESPPPASEDVSIILSVETEAEKQPSRDTENDDDDVVRLVRTQSSESSDDTTPPASADELASRLDSLGWTKHFVDLRSTLYTVPNPFAAKSNDDTTATTTTTTDASTVVIDPTKSTPRQYYTSSELWRLYTRFPTDRWHFPMGHSMLLANAKDALNEKLNAAGKPLMDQLARMLVEDIIITQE